MGILSRQARRPVRVCAHFLDQANIAEMSAAARKPSVRGVVASALSRADQFVHEVGQAPWFGEVLRAVGFQEEPEEEW